MKTKVEVNGYEITIEEIDGLVTVKAEKDEEVVEEFSLETEGQEEGEEGQDDDEIKGFDKFGGEEDDLEGGASAGEEEIPNEEEEEEEEEEDQNESLKSFQSFINKKK